MQVPGERRNKVFISYSHQDSEWLKRLQIHLKDLERRGLVELWDDTKIRPGAKWRQEISDALASACVAILLVSADFIASDFVAEDELPPLLAAAESDGVAILLLILSPSRFEQMESLARFHSVNPPSKPLIGLTKVEQEQYLVKLGNDVLRSVKEGFTSKNQLRKEALPIPRRKSSNSKVEKRAKWILVLSGTVEDIDKERAEAIAAHLRLLSGDMTLTIQKIEAGSVRLTMESTITGFEKIKTPYERGDLREVMGIEILAVTVIEPRKLLSAVLKKRFPDMTNEEITAMEVQILTYIASGLEEGWQIALAWGEEEHMDIRILTMASLKSSD
jgi:hypothetical protein